MVVDDLFGVVHAAVTDFDGVAVKYFAETIDSDLSTGFWFPAFARIFPCCCCYFSLVIEFNSSKKW